MHGKLMEVIWVHLEEKVELVQVLGEGGCDAHKGVQGAFRLPRALLL